MASTWYTNAIGQGLGSLNLPGSTVQAMLLDANATTPDDPDHDFVADIVADEMADATYARQTLVNVAVAEDAANNRYGIDSDDIDFGNLENGGTPLLFLVIYKLVTNDADSILISCHAITATPDGTQLIFQPGSAGFATATATAS